MDSSHTLSHNLIFNKDKKKTDHCLFVCMYVLSKTCKQSDKGTAEYDWPQLLQYQAFYIRYPVPQKHLIPDGENTLRTRKIQKHYLFYSSNKTVHSPTHLKIIVWPQCCLNNNELKCLVSQNTENLLLIVGKMNRPMTCHWL